MKNKEEYIMNNNNNNNNIIIDIITFIFMAIEFIIIVINDQFLKTSACIFLSYILYLH